MSECNHIRGFDWIQYEGGGLFTEKPIAVADRVDWFAYCPNCGEKLPPPPSEDTP